MKAIDDNKKDIGVRKLVEKYGCGMTQINEILKNKKMHLKKHSENKMKWQQIVADWEIHRFQDQFCKKVNWKLTKKFVLVSLKLLMDVSKILLET